MICVNIARSGRTAVTETQLMEAACGNWADITDKSLEDYADVLLAVQRNVVRGAYRIRGWERQTGGRVRFDIEADEQLATWAGAESPVRWRRGQANPVAFLDTATAPLDTGDGSGASLMSRPRKKARRSTHRITIETRGLTDDEAARLHHSLITVAKGSGHLHDYRSTSLVKEINKAKEDMDYDYHSADSPPAI